MDGTSVQSHCVCHIGDFSRIVNSYIVGMYLIRTGQNDTKEEVCRNAKSQQE